MSELVIVQFPHDDLPHDSYHEWVTFGHRVKADSRGRRNPRMYCASWTKWVCDNPDCFAEALVSDQAIQNLLDGAA